MAICPCGKGIEEWKAVCKECWWALGRYDKKFGSRFQKMVVYQLEHNKRRDVLNADMLKVLKDRILSRRSRRIASLRAKMTKYCINCETKTGQKSVDECFTCSFHSMINQMFKQIINGH